MKKKKQKRNSNQIKRSFTMNNFNAVQKKAQADGSKPKLYRVTPLNVTKYPIYRMAEFELTCERVIVFYTVRPFTLYITILTHHTSAKSDWHKSIPIWKTLELITPKDVNLYQHSTGMTELEFSYHKRSTVSKRKHISSIHLPLNKHLKTAARSITEKRLDRVPENPILQPISSNRWESLAVFNPAAIYLDNKIHLIYRAIGDDGLSTFGYANSIDGTTVTTRLPYPVYFTANTKNIESTHDFNQLSQYQSGVSWSGCEDPRLSQVGDTIYMTYTAFNGIEPPGVALTSIKTNDFLAHRWNWSVPKLISKPQVMQKNWVLFPEKINGKFVILHSLAPKVQLEYLDDLNFSRKNYINSYFSPNVREKHWDSQMRGVGPPPIKTSKGWLVFYHAMDCRDPNRYKVGVMLLNLKEPQRVLARTSYPILEPDARYENNGYKQGVVYTCGAVIIGKHLFVYYGGADTVICTAFIELNDLLAQFIDSKKPPLKNAFIRIRKKKVLKYGYRRKIY